MATADEIKAKKDKFIELYLGAANGNQSEAARLAGYSVKRAGVTASELMKDPYVLAKIKQVHAVKQDFVTDNVESIEDIFATVGPEALRKLANEAKHDSDAAQKFLKLKLDFEKRKTEVLGEYEGLSTQEIIGRFNSCIEEGRSLIARIMETSGTEEMQTGLDVFVLGSTSESRPSAESVGGHTPQDSQSIGHIDGGGFGSILDTSRSLEVNTSDTELGTTAVDKETDSEDIDCISELETLEEVPGSD